MLSATNMARTPKSNSHQKTIVFLHPDLGIGGAERLVVDAAVGLQKRGHKVVIFTSHCDPQHCFDEARDGTLDVRVRGNTIVPASIFSRFSILCAILRQVHLILQVWLSSELTSRKLSVDAFFVDQLSAGLPLLQLFYPSKAIFFYCHYPDLHLAQGRNKWWKRVWRLPFDTLEQWSMGYADTIAVNSNFTKSVVTATWPTLAKQNDLQTVYPCVDVNPPEIPDVTDPLWNGKKFILSINRFERKKEIDLALRAFADLPPSTRAGSRLVLAGGHDPRIAENVDYHHELESLASSLKLRHLTVSTLPTALHGVPDDVDVLFVLSAPALLKRVLLRDALLLAYTPSGEHFGIVPLEAMLVGTPVLAATTGGPVETVVDGETGWLRKAGDVPAWAEVMGTALGRSGGKRNDDDMARKGIQRVRDVFSEETMAETLESILTKSVQGVDRTYSAGQRGSSCLPVLLTLVGIVGASVAVGVWFLTATGDAQQQ